MEHDKDCMCHLCLPGISELRLPRKEVPPPNPPPAGDSEEPTPNPSQEGNKSVDKGERDYTRQMYQNLLAVVELLEVKSPLAISQKQIQRELNISKGVSHDICWNLCARGWVEDMGSGMVRLKKIRAEKVLQVGRMMIRNIRDLYGIILDED